MNDNDTDIALIILAAGMSRRMGAQNKLLKHWQGLPLIRYAANAAANSICNPVIIVTGHQQQLISEAIANPLLTFIYNKHYETGMASSVKIGANYAEHQNCQGLIVLPGDMPKITVEIINNIAREGIRHKGENIIIAAHGEKRGNPVYWPKKYFQQLQMLDKDTGGRALFAQHSDHIKLLDIGPTARFDLDTADAFAPKN